MSMIICKLSRTAPAPTWISQVECRTPKQLVKAVKGSGDNFCHYFDEDGNELTMDDALEILGVPPEKMRAFKKQHGFFVLDEPKTPVNHDKFWQIMNRVLIVTLVIVLMIALAIALRYYGLI